MDKIDARKLKPEGRNQLRQCLLRLRQPSRMAADDLARVAGVHVSTVKGWLARAKREGIGSLTERRRDRPVGTCRKLTLAQEVWLREQIIGSNPQLLTLPFALWTRPAIRALIRSRFGLEVQDRLIGKYLKRWGFTPQQPIQQALEQRPEALTRWLHQTDPALVIKARAEGGVIYFGDDGGAGGCELGAGPCPQGQTPVLATPTCWDKLSMISAISPRGEVAFRIVDGSSNADRFIEFLAALIEGAPHKIILVVDNLRVGASHKSRDRVAGG